jgi:hypothetical protein
LSLFAIILTEVCGSEVQVGEDLTRAGKINTTFLKRSVSLVLVEFYPQGFIVCTLNGKSKFDFRMAEGYYLNSRKISCRD